MVRIGMIALAGMVAGYAFAQDTPEAPKSPHASVRLVSEQDALVPGTTASLALTFEIEKNWHLYWNGLIEEGMTPTWRLALPERYEVQEAQWPVPERLLQPGDVLAHVYEHAVTIIVPVKVPAAAKPGESVTITGDVSWMICGSICVPEDAKISLTLPVRATAKASADAPKFADARKQHPEPIARAKPAVRASVVDGSLEVDAPGATRASFFPGLGSVEVPEIVKQGDRKAARLSVRLEQSAGGRVVGLVRVERAGSPPKGYWIDIPVGPKPPELP